MPQGCVCNVAVSYFEVYNERVLDLLQTVGTDKDRRRLPQLLLPEDGAPPSSPSACPLPPHTRHV